MARKKLRDPMITVRGRPRQRWPAPRTPDGTKRYDKLAFRLSTELREEIALLADLDRMPVSSWIERVVTAEVDRRRDVDG